MNSTNLKMAAVQMISGPEAAPNLVTAERLIGEAAAKGATLVVLPEYFPFIGAQDADRLLAREREGEGPIQTFLSKTAVKYGVWLVGGSLPLFAEDPSKMRNTSFVFDNTGRMAARYDKIHLFAFKKGAESYEEASTIESGHEVVAFDSPFGRVGLAICYDLRFPELFRAMGEVDVIALPAAFTETTGRAHWELLIRARAVENQCYVIAAAQGGRHPTGRLTHGNSMIVDPWGKIIARLDKGEGVIVAELEHKRISETRACLPALKHKVLINSHGHEAHPCHMKAVQCN